MFDLTKRMLENKQKLAIYAAREGNFNIFKIVIDYLIETEGPNSVRFEDFVILRQSCARGHLNIVQYICEHFPPIGDFKYGSCYYNYGPFELACGNGHIGVVQYLFETYDISHSIIQAGISKAAENGFIQIINYFSQLSRGGPRRGHFVFENALYLSLFYKHMDIFNYLLQYSTKLNINIQAKNDAIVKNLAKRFEYPRILRGILERYYTFEDIYRINRYFKQYEAYKGPHHFDAPNNPDKTIQLFKQMYYLDIIKRTCGAPKGLGETPRGAPSGHLPLEIQNIILSYLTDLFL